MSWQEKVRNLPVIRDITTQEVDTQVMESIPLAHDSSKRLYIGKRLDNGRVLNRILSAAPNIGRGYGWVPPLQPGEILRMRAPKAHVLMRRNDHLAPTEK